MQALKDDGSSDGKAGKNKSTEGVRRRAVTLFTIVSALVTIVIGVAIGLRIADTIKQEITEAYVLSTATQVNGTLHTYLDEKDFDEPFTGQKYDDFYGFINQAVDGTNVVKVKLWALDGTVLFSNDKELVGRQFSSKEPLQVAVGGKPHYEITKLEADENYRERSEFNRLLEIYYPIENKETGKVYGVYEVYMSLLPLEQYVNRTMKSLGYGLAVLVLILVGIAEVASLMLRRRNDALRSLSSKLEKQADTDGLTGLYNHRHFQNYLDKEISRALRYNQNISLLMVDLDFFKTINDRYGHQIGDEVLLRVAGIFETVLRDVDYAARYGGEEFVAVLPGTDAKGAMVVAERLRAEAESLDTGHGEKGGAKLKVTLSCGVADFPSCATEREGLVAAADSALLFAKRRGRNRVYYFRDISSSDIQEGDLDKLVSRLQHASMPTIQALMAAVDTRDAYDRSRSRDVGTLAQRFASAVDLEENMSYALGMAAQVHDIGKIAVPERVLGKSEPLTETEMEAIRSHPEASAKIVESAAQVEQLLGGVLHHHENWDGSGYPDGLTAEEIPILARMLRILDSYEAMTSDRPYRKALSSVDALKELEKNASKLYDPTLVETFVTFISKGGVNALEGQDKGEEKTTLPGSKGD